MAYYSFTPTKGAYGHGVADIDSTKGINHWDFTVLGTEDGKTYIASDATDIPTQPEDINFKKIKTLPTAIRALIDSAQLEQEMKDTENRISEIKDELLTAVLLDDTETVDSLKAEYKKLMEG